MKKLLSLLLVVLIVVSFAACSSNVGTSKYTKENTLGSIVYSTSPNWFFEEETSNGSVYHYYCLSEDKDVNSGAISLKYLATEEITEEVLSDKNKLTEMFDEIIDGQEIEKKIDRKIANYPGIEFYREDNYIDGPLKLKCCIFFLPGGVYMIEAGSLEKLNSNVESAYEKLIKTIVVNSTTNSSESSNESEDIKEELTESKVTVNNKKDDDIRPEFKEAMDAYEDFYDEYCEFMEKYKKNPTDLSLLGKYTEMLTKLEEMNNAFEAWDEDEMSKAELKYYLEVNNRVMQKMVDVTGE